jgi:predicted N-acetyltransferase YhbS
MKVESLDRRNMSDADARAVAELLVKVWTRRTFDERVAQLQNDWRAYDGPKEFYPRSFIVRDGSRVIAHAAAVPRTIGTSEGDMTIVALAQVCSDPELRGQKLGQAVVRAVFDLVDHGPYEHSLYQTSHAVRPFYEKLGAGLVTNRIVNSLGTNPEMNPFWDEIAMRYPAAKHWPEGDIDLRGPGY